MNRSRWRLGVVILSTIIGATACRFGFDPSADTFSFTADGDMPFGGAETDGIDLAADGASLAMGSGFGVMDERLPAPVSAAAATALGDHFLVSGGAHGYLSTSNCSQDMLLLDPAGGGLNLAGRLPFTKQGAAMQPAQDGALLHLMGYCGESSAEESKVLRNLQPAPDFLELGRFPVAAYHFSSGLVTLADGREHLLVAGGYGCGPLTAAVQSMATEDGQATRAGVDLPTERCLAAGASWNDALYLFGGSGHTDCDPPANSCDNPLLSDIVEVGLEPERAQVVASLPEPTADACAVTRPDGSVLVFGGLRYSEAADCDFQLETTDAVILFDPDTGQVSPLADRLPQPRAGMACAINESGRVALFGGVNGDRTTSDEILVYEPYASQGTLIGPPVDARMPQARWDSLELDADIPDGTSITVQVRTAEAPQDIRDLAWQESAPGPLPADLARGRYLQWRLLLHSRSPLTTPVVRGISVHFQAD